MKTTMSLKETIANAVRQSSLAKSSRMGELLNRFERRSCVTPDDIDFLIDEIVKRIEERLLCRLAMLPELALDQVREGDEQDTKAAKLPVRPRHVVSDSTLRHQARLLVDQVLKIVIRHLQLVGQKKARTDERKFKQSGRAMTTSTEYGASTSRDVDSKISPQLVKRYNYEMSKQAKPRHLKETQPTDTEEAPAYRKPLPIQDGDSVRTATTYALRKADKVSLRRYSVTSNVNALMRAGEWAKDDDIMGVYTEPKPVSKTVTTPIHQDVKILLASSGDSSDDRDYRNTPRDDAPVEYSFAPVTPRRELPKTQGISQFLNSSFTYARRAEIKKSLPKFLASRSREAMMTLFNAIRIAMAEEEIEHLDYAGLLATLMIDQSQGGKDLPQYATTSKPKTTFPQQSGKYKRPLEKKADAKPRYDHLRESRGKQVPSQVVSMSRDERKTVAFDEEPPRRETSGDERAKYSKGGDHRQSATNYTYGIHRSLRRLLPKFTGGKPYTALLHYADGLIADVYQEMIRTGQLIPSTTSSRTTEPRRVKEKVTSVEARYIKPTAGDRQSVSTQTGKTVAKTSSEELFHDAYSWIAKISSDKDDTMSEKQRYQEQALPTKSDRVTYRPVEDMDIFEQAASLQGTRGYERDGEPLDDGADDGLWMSVDETEADDGAKRSVRFADGIYPGETDNGDLDQTSRFFQKLGYYERVGSGEFLHKKTKTSKQKDEEPSASSQAGLKQECDYDERQQPERPQEKPEERPLSEAPQQTDEATKPSYSLCNCL